MAFTFNTGTVRMPICNENGVEIGAAVYNPKDFGIFQRAQKNQHMLDEVKEIFTKYAEADEQTEADALATMESACQKLEEYCNTIFGKGFYAEAFKNINPFTELESGEWYCVEIVKAVIEDIAQRVNRRQAAENKYLAGYQNKNRAARRKKNA